MVRSRRGDAAGPWTARSEQGWRVRAVSEDLRLLHADGTEEECQDIIRQILERRRLTAEGTEIHYALHPSPKHHKAYRDHLGDADRVVSSPFPHHSAGITEYWSFEQELMEQWLDRTDSLGAVYKSVCTDLGFPLDRASDRVGNILIARAEDSLTADLSFDPHGKQLRFQIRTHGTEPTAFPSDVWASSSGNEVLRQHICARSGVTSIKVPYDVDHIGFAIYDETTRDCIDLMNVSLVMEAHFDLNMQSGPSLHLRGTNKKTIHVHTPVYREVITVDGRQRESGHDAEIRTKWKDRLRFNQESSARRHRTLARFSAPDHERATRFFLNVLREDADSNKPIYIADPWFLPSKNDIFLSMLYLRIFGETAGQGLRVLCSNRGLPDARAWWSSIPSQMTNHVVIRSFTPRSGHGVCFHDRYVVTPRREIIVTNSFNGWPEHGVTFAAVESDVYRSEAEDLWARDVESQDAEIVVTEIVPRSE